jgi:hypothetical protein
LPENRYNLTNKYGSKMEQKRQSRAEGCRGRRNCSSIPVDSEDKPDFLTPDKKLFLEIRDHLLYFEKESIEWYKKHKDDGL